VPGRTADVPDGMRLVYGRFVRWRKLHIGRVPIPDSLWSAAAELAREYGVFKTAKVLRLYIPRPRLRIIRAIPGASQRESP